MTAPLDPERRHPGDGPVAGDPPPLTSEEEREVAALLAEAVGRGPVSPPPDVVARLDDVLAELVAERGATRTPGEPVPEPGPETGGTVVRLESRRRRRLPRALLAAAAVVVGGYAVGNLAFDGSLTGDGLRTGSADSAAGGGSAGDSAGRSSADSGGSTDSKELGGLADDNPMVRLPPVRREHLAADVRSVVRQVRQLRVTGQPDRVLPSPDPSPDPNPDPSENPSDNPRRSSGSVEDTPDCTLPRLTDTQRLYRVSYRGAPAGLVVGKARQGTVDVTIYSCRTGGVELSRAVPAP